MDLKSLMAFPPIQSNRRPTTNYLQIISLSLRRLDYYHREFSDSYAEEVVRLSQHDLNQVERKIGLRNKNRLVKYNFLKPSLVLNSTSI
ncbi:MAG: hypothetical protein AAFX80_03230 [Cyanobacteria bacterium J06639_18]